MRTVFQNVRVEDKKASEQGQDDLDRQPVANAVRHPAGDILVSSRQPQRSRMGHRSISSKRDKRSSIRSDPNRADDPEYIVRLVGQVVRVSLETVRIVSGLPAKFSP